MKLLANNDSHFQKVGTEEKQRIIDNEILWQSWPQIIWLVFVGSMKLKFLTQVISLVGKPTKHDINDNIRVSEIAQLVSFPISQLEKKGKASIQYISCFAKQTHANQLISGKLCSSTAGSAESCLLHVMLGVL